jgi:hypothetical protein
VNQRGAVIGGALVHGFAPEDVVDAFDSGDIERAAVENTRSLDTYNAGAYWEACRKGLDWQSRGGVYGMPQVLAECRHAAILIDAGRTARMEDVAHWVRTVGRTTRSLCLLAAGYAGAVGALYLGQPRTRNAVTLTATSGVLAGVLAGWWPSALARRGVVSAFGAAAIQLAV